MKKLLVMLVFVASTAHGEIYTWTDSRGTAHYTNSEYEIPVRYRAKAKVLDLGIEQKKEASSPQQNGQMQPVKPEEQPTAPKAGGNLMQQNAPLQPGTDKPGQLRQKWEERRRERARSRGGKSGEVPEE